MTIQSTNIFIKPVFFEKLVFSTIKENLSRLDWTVFLESVDKDHINSRWSIFSADPVATLQSKQNEIFVDGIDIAFTQDDNPLEICNQIRVKLFAEQVSKDLDTNEIPFSGGVLGALNYELGHRFENIKNTDSPEQLDIEDATLGFYDWAIILDNQKDQFFLVVRKHKLSLEPLSSYFETRLAWLLSFSEKKSIPEPFALSSSWKSNMSKHDYINKFKRVQRYILEGDCYQVNLAQRFEADYSGNEYQAYQQLVLQNSAPFSAFLQLPTHTILSLSPERFLKLTAKNIETKPIKGTRPRFSDPILDNASKAELISSAKDRAENLMIVDLLRNDIGKVSSPGSVKVPNLFEIESFPAVHHLVSTITSELAPKHTTETLIGACFPGGSITGAPKIRAMEIISELEPNSRDVYCGSIGYIDAGGDMDFNISIRTLLCFKNKIYCWAGGGLIADSQVDLEYQECFDKVNRILPILNDLVVCN